MSFKTLNSLPTPCLLLDQAKLEANIQRMAQHIGGLGGTLRPHVKTNKSIDVTRKIIEGGATKGITVSTLREAEYFFENGVTDIMYAVGIAPNKFDHVAQLMTKGCQLEIVLDSVDMAKRVVADGEGRGIVYSVLIELDTDGHRSGADPNGETLLEIARVLSRGSGAALTGVMTHAGESYNCRTPEALLAIAKQERDLTVLAAERIRRAGFDCPVVSIGSTPTALSIDSLAGVTEVRAGVYVFFDLVMAGIGVSTPNDIAVSVLCSIIGHQDEKGWAISDGGWMAMSRDRGVAAQAVDYGYGLVVDRAGEPISDFIVSGANQEHGIITSRTNANRADSATLPLGALIRVLPNHACATASQYDRYYVVSGETVVAEWPRINGW